MIGYMTDLIRSLLHLQAIILVSQVISQNWTTLLAIGR
jgi:hypothetical protein